MRCHVVEGVMGNREVARVAILRGRADASAARSEAILEEEEGGPRGNPGFPRATEPKAQEHVA
jgi:hypothetical protein